MSIESVFDTAPAENLSRDREHTGGSNSSTSQQSITSTSTVTVMTNHQAPYYPYEIIVPITHTHFTRTTTSYWQGIIPTSSVSSLSYSTASPYQYSFAASLTPETSLLLPIRPLGDTTNGIVVCSLTLPHASMTVVKELARVVADRIRKFEPEGCRLVDWFWRLLWRRNWALVRLCS